MTPLTKASQRSLASDVLDLGQPWEQKPSRRSTEQVRSRWSLAYTCTEPFVNLRRFPSSAARPPLVRRIFPSFLPSFHRLPLLVCRQTTIKQIGSHKFLLPNAPTSKFKNKNVQIIPNLKRKSTFKAYTLS